MSASHNEVKVLEQREKELELTLSQGKLAIQDIIEMLDHLADIRARTPDIRPCSQALHAVFEHIEVQDSRIEKSQPGIAALLLREADLPFVPPTGLEPARPYGHRSSTCRVCHFHHGGNNTSTV